MASTVWRVKSSAATAASPDQFVRAVSLLSAAATSARALGRPVSPLATSVEPVPNVARKS
jgi:hypothetical protein